MRPIATVTELATAKKSLTYLGVRTESLPRARARAPTGQESFNVDAASSDVTAPPGASWAERSVWRFLYAVPGSSERTTT